MVKTHTKIPINLETKIPQTWDKASYAAHHTKFLWKFRFIFFGKII